jgi:hypothetical protein
MKQDVILLRLIFEHTGSPAPDVGEAVIQHLRETFNDDNSLIEADLCIAFEREVEG